MPDVADRDVTMAGWPEDDGTPKKSDACEDVWRRWIGPPTWVEEAELSAIMASSSRGCRQGSEAGTEKVRDVRGGRGGHGGMGIISVKRVAEGATGLSAKDGRTTRLAPSRRTLSPMSGHMVG